MSTIEHHTPLTQALTTALRAWDGRTERTFITDTVLPIIAADAATAAAARTRSLLADQCAWQGYVRGLRFALKEGVDVEARIAAELGHAEQRLTSILRDLERDQGK